MLRSAVSWNGLQLLGWMSVLVLSILYRHDCPVFLLMFTAVIQALNGYDLRQHLLAGRRSAVWPWVLQNGARILFLGLLWYARQLGIRFGLGGLADMASVLLIVWSLAEISRFLFYTFPGRVSRWLRYNAFLLAYPLGVVIELGWMYQLWCGMVFIFGKIFLSLLFIAYLFGFPYLFLHLCHKRKQVLSHE